MQILLFLMLILKSSLNIASNLQVLAIFEDAKPVLNMPNKIIKTFNWDQKIKDHPFLPIKSKYLPGQIANKNLNLDFNFSFFIVGFDDLSLNWLQKYSKKLTAYNAIGFVTNVNSSAELSQLESIYTKKLLPIEIDTIMSISKVKHYPFIFHKGSILQCL